MDPITPYQKRIRAVVGLKFAVLFATIALSLFYISKIDSDSDWVIHTHEVETLVNKVQTEARDVDASVRGYVITREVRYLGFLEANWREIETDIAALKVLTSDNPVQQENIEKLMPLIDKRHDIANELLHTNAEEAAKLIKSSVNSDTIEQIRSIGKLMIAEEDRLLVQRQTLKTSRVYQAYIVLPLLVIVAIILLIVLQIMIH